MTHVKPILIFFGGSERSKANRMRRNIYIYIYSQSLLRRDDIFMYDALLFMRSHHNFCDRNKRAASFNFFAFSSTFSEIQIKIAFGCCKRNCNQWFSQGFGAN